jgi:hypothetical protein
MTKLLEFVVLLAVYGTLLIINLILVGSMHRDDGKLHTNSPTGSRV